MNRICRYLSAWALVQVCGCSSDGQPIAPPDPQFGAISIAVEPAFLPLMWSVASTDSVIASGAGEAFVVGIPIGEVVITFGAIPGWALLGENPITQTVAADDTTKVVVQFGMPLASTADQLVQNLRTGYEYRQLKFVQDSIAANYASYLQQETRDQFPSVGATIDAQEELTISGRLFEGQPVVNSNGETMPGIASIAVPVLDRSSDWVVAGSGERIPGALAADYSASIRLSYPSGHTLVSTGTIRFFASQRDSVINGETQPYWRLAGQDDLTSTIKTIEYVLWGTARALYW